MMTEAAIEIALVGTQDNEQQLGEEERSSRSLKMKLIRGGLPHLPIAISLSACFKICPFSLAGQTRDAFPCPPAGECVASGRGVKPSGAACLAECIVAASVADCVYR